MRASMTARTMQLMIGACLLCVDGVTAQSDTPSGSLMAQAIRQATVVGGSPSVSAVSLFDVPPPEPRTFAKHDLVQIIVRETSRSLSTQELDTEKTFEIAGEIAAFPNLQLSDLLNFQMFGGRTDNLPRLDIAFGKEFQGDGAYERSDDVVARLNAEVIEVLPNGNLVLEARTEIQNDEERSVMTVTGTCSPSDVSGANTVLSSQIHDLKVAKINSGELKKTNEKGLVAKFFDFLFAW